MSALAALLLAAVAPQSGASLDAAALAAFDGHCAVLDGMDAMAGRMTRAGWAEFTPEAGSDLGKLLNHTPGATGDVPDFTYKSRAFAPTGNRSLVAVITQAGIPTLSSLECRIVAIDATAPPSADLVKRWAKRDATESFNESGLTAWRWEPGLGEGLRETSIAFVAKDSPLRAELPVVGLIVQASKETRK